MYESGKMLCIIDNDTESWIMEVDRCGNYPENFVADIQCQKFGHLII